MNAPAVSSLTAPNGRSIKFTPERFEQIKNLVERGMSREQIAETIGVTLGSLQVTCSRVGISLRRRSQINARTALPRQRREGPSMDAHEAKLFLVMKYQGQERASEIPLSQDMLGRLAIEAHFQDMSLTDLAAKVIEQIINRDGSK